MGLLADPPDTGDGDAETSAAETFTPLRDNFR